MPDGRFAMSVTTPVPCIVCGKTVTDTCMKDWRGCWHKDCDPAKARFPQYDYYARDMRALKLRRYERYN